MLQRAANNAHSWWYASHIRTKQSKWLDQSLEDMEEKVQHMLKLIEQDGDSFAKRAEMYYKRRPELINSVEDAYRAFRALAERYDKLSKDLHTANHTIATVFPEQIQVAMEEDDDFGSPRLSKNLQLPPTANESSGPKFPKAPKKDLKTVITSPSKHFQFKKISNAEDANTPPAAKSGLTKTEALEEIDKLQQDICYLQTVKEFVRSSYENGLAKFQEIEKRIMEMQQRVCKLQDEFGVARVIGDDKAQNLMAEAALKSCQESLAELKEKQKICAREAKEEYQKIENAHRKLKSLKCEHLHDQTGEKHQSVKAEDGSQSSNQEVGYVTEGLQQKFKEQFDGNSKEYLTVTELTMKIDELVNRVVNLEITVASQTAVIDRLRTEANDLHTQIQSLEDDKASLTEDKQKMSIRVKELEEQLKGIQNLNRDVENQNKSLQARLAEALCGLDHLSKKLNTVKPDEEIEVMDSPLAIAEAQADLKSEEDMEKKRDTPSPGDGPLAFSTLKTGEQEVTKIQRVEIEQGPNAGASNQKGEITKSEVKSVTFADPKTFAVPMQPQKSNEENSPQLVDSVLKSQPEDDLENDEKFNWQKMLLNGVEDREIVLLKEYTTILRSYKDLKKKLDDMEQKDRDSQFEVTLQISDLKSAIAKRDEEIQHLRKKLNPLPGVSEEEKSAMLDTSTKQSVKPKDTAEDDSKMILINKPAHISPVEEKLRMKIDAVLDENLDFSLRFSSSFHQIQKFKTTIKDLQDKLMRAKAKKAQGTSFHTGIKSEIQPIYKHLREIHTELTTWMEQSLLLKDELERRSLSLCQIQDEITQALKEGVEEEEIRFSSHQAAKFHGEVLNMKQEHTKVREELQVGMDHVTALQVDVEKTLKHLNHDYGLFVDQPDMTNSKIRTRIPLRAFIFGTKLKKQRRSVFSCIKSEKYEVLRDGVPS